MAVPREPSVVFVCPAAAECETSGLGLVTRYPRPGFSSVETTGSPKFLGNPNVRLRMFSRRRQDCLYQTITVQQHGPWYVNRKGSRERSFDAQ
jgi:hypothetical protein